MPRIFDNIDAALLPALQDGLKVSSRADFSVGYFNLRGWRGIDSLIEAFGGGDGACCRLLVGMQTLPQDELRDAYSLVQRDNNVDLQTALRLKRRAAEEFRQQLVWGFPTDEDEAGLRRLCGQLKTKKVVVKLFLRHPLHAKLYLLHRPDVVSPMIGFLGSSNLTLAGLSKQGELNVDVLDHDACAKLAKWFEERWADKFCLDISDDLAEVIQESWARVVPPSPYQIYVKIAWHLSNEARAGVSEFRIPSDIPDQLLEFQKAAVKIAAHHLNKRGGVILGDVVGLGKTLMASTLARIFEDDHGLETLIVCPKNLIPMWEEHRARFRLRAKVISVTSVQNELPDLRRYRLVLIDESHYLRNREGKRYRALAEYIQSNDSKVIMLSATPYNKSYLDLSNQLRLVVPEDRDIGVRPERLLRELTEVEFRRKHQCSPRTLRAFEFSNYADDWRELMRLYLVRRTRSFIRDNYAKTDPQSGRKYLEFDDGTRSPFPDRIPKTLKFSIDDKRPDDQYARLLADDTVTTLTNLFLPRYGLGNYVKPSPTHPPTNEEARILGDLSRAGNRLRGFCRTVLFKRLESSGYCFLVSLARHILRNFVFVQAIEQGAMIPIGTQDQGLLDSAIIDADTDLFDEDDGSNGNGANEPVAIGLRTEDDFRRRAAEAYNVYSGPLKRRFRWLPAGLFAKSLAEHLLKDARALIRILSSAGDWNWNKDAKLNELARLLTKTHPSEKVLIFTQFAETAGYLESCLKSLGLNKIAAVTGDSANPTAMAWRFSPVSNGKQISAADELRVIIATDVLSEGQNLQDCAIIVNYDLPWAIIRLVQRAGRIDRIGQKAEQLRCYSFLPADGVERIIRLRARVRQRLRENAEVIGTDEQFFDDDGDDQPLVDLYNEKAGIFDGEDDTEVDLASYAYQVWKNAIDKDPELERTIPNLPNVVFSTRSFVPAPGQSDGVLVYSRTADGNDALAWVDGNGNTVTESQFTILKAAECAPDAPTVPRRDDHHTLVRKAVEKIIAEEQNVGGGLGSPRGARFRTYDRLMRYLESLKGTLFERSEQATELRKAIEEIYRYPLLQTATETLNRQLKSGVGDAELSRLVLSLRADGRLCNVSVDGVDRREPQIICSLGLITRH
jgi:superfamily II DNA or RNA helicase